MAKKAGNLVLVGQAPGRNGEGKEPFEGSKRLAVLLAADPIRINLLDRWPGKQGKGDAFPIPKAKRKAAEITPRLEGMTVVLAGKKVAEAFGIRQEYFQSTTRDGAVFITIPHPSGINRWWNDPGNREKAGQFFEEMI